MLMNDKDKCLPKSYFLTKGNLKRYEDRIWNFFFRTERKCFRKKKYSFHHMICTDGISCSVILIRNDMIGKRIPKKKLPQLEQYIDELDKKEYDKLKCKKIVACDPNKSDLLYCIDGTTKDRNQYRYTQDQRRKETKMKKYRNIQNDLKTKKKIEKKNIIEIETELSDKNKKTLNIKKFKEYIKEKNKINEKLFKFYENEIFRKLRLDNYINKMQNEQKMIKEFIATFGKPKNTIVCIGDFEQKHQMKYKEPTKGKSLRMLLRKHGFDVYMVNEFRTSCRCFKCEGECETFRTCENPRPWRKDEIILRHGLIMCKTCKALWNRDENSSCNIYKIAQLAVYGKDRPTYLCREIRKQLSGVTSTSHKQNLRKSVKAKP
jgi:transposase